MALTLNLAPEAAARLRRRAEQTGLSAEQAAREVLQAAQQPPDSLWNVLGLILLLALLVKEPSPEVEQAIRDTFQPYVDHLLANGTEEQLAALLPAMPTALNTSIFSEAPTTEAWLADFDAWVESHRGLPPLPREALNREYYYEDHD